MVFNKEIIEILEKLFELYSYVILKKLKKLELIIFLYSCIILEIIIVSLFVS